MFLKLNLTGGADALSIAGQPRRPYQSAVGRGLISVCFAWIALCLLIATGADLLSPFDPNAIDLRARLQFTSIFAGDFRHILGTDELGRDMLSRLLHATRVSVLFAAGAVLVGAVFGICMGFLAAAFRGWVDELVSLLIDSQLAIPHMLMALMVIAFAGTGLPVLIVVIGTYGWERYARLSRSLALAMLGRGFVAAARTYGVGRWSLFARHILPNIAGALIVNATLTFPETMLVESSLSFLGLGLQPPTASLGNMVGLGREHILDAWWVAVWPGMAIFFTALAVSLLGDALRDEMTS